jgi:hypothetical protein
MLKYIICIVVHSPIDNEIVHYTNSVMKNYVNIMTSNQAKMCIIPLFILVHYPHPIFFYYKAEDPSLCN